MRRQRFAAAVALSTALALLAHGIAAGAKEPKKAKDPVTVRLQGARAFPPKEVLEAAGVKASVGQWLLHRPPKAERSDLEAIAESVRNFYQRHGYFDAAVAVERPGANAVLISVVEGPPCIVKTVSVSLAPDTLPGAADPQILGRDLPLRVGQAFSADLYEAAGALLLQRMKEDGRAFAEVKPEAVVDLALHEVAVTFLLSPGARCTVGQVEFVGRKLSEERILRRALTFAPGDLYRQSKVDESRDNLYKLGLFESVIMRTLAGASPDTVNVRVRLVEGKLQRVRLGIGYGTEDLLRAQVRWETLRFAGHTMVVGAEAKASAIDDKLETYLRRPYIFDAKTTLLSSLTLGRKVEQDFDYNYLKAQGGLQRDFLADRLRGTAFLVFERVLEFTPNQSLEDALAGGARQVVSMGSVAASLTYKTTDAPMDPARGMIASLYVEPTQVLDGGTFFTKAILEGRQYFTLRPEWVVALRVKAGGICTGNPEGVPLTRRFYAGGANSIRGYGYDTLGPLSPEGALLGGDGLLEASAELRFPLKGNLRGVAFIDAGNALPKAFEFPKDWLRAGTGAGLRYQTPVGPVGLDIAWRLKKDPQNPAPYQIYFFIGYAF